MKKQLVIGISIVFLFFACKGEQHEKEISDINSLRNKLEMTELLLKNVDHDMAERLGTEMKNNSQFIQFNILKIGDTLDFKTALFLSNYKMILDAMEGVASNGERLDIAIDSTKKTLDNLEHDITNNTLSKGLVAATCIKQEEERVNEMYEFAGEMRSNLEKAKVGYDSLAPKVNTYMKELTRKLEEKSAAVPKK